MKLDFKFLFLLICGIRIDCVSSRLLRPSLSLIRKRS